jgi:hypothetical protein
VEKNPAKNGTSFALAFYRQQLALLLRVKDPGLDVAYLSFLFALCVFA